MPEVLLLPAPSSGIANVAPRPTNTWLFASYNTFNAYYYNQSYDQPYGPVVYGGLLWIYGGYPGMGDPGAELYVQAYNPAAQATTAVLENASLTQGQAGFAQPLADTVVWCGGLSSTTNTLVTTTTGMLIDQAFLGQLATLAALPTALEWMGSAATGGLVYCLSGSNTVADLNTPSDTAYAFTPTANAWTTLAAPPTGLVLPLGAAAWGLVWQITGTSSSGGADIVYYYNPQANAWSTASNRTPVFNYAGASAYAGGLLYCSFGAGASTSPATAVLSAPGFTWTTIANPNSNQTGDYSSIPGFVDFDGAIYLVAGGYTLSGILTAAWADARPYPSTAPVEGTMAYVQASSGESALFWGAKDPSGAVVWRKLDQSGPTAVT